VRKMRRFVLGFSFRVFRFLVALMAYLVNFPGKDETPVPIHGLGGGVGEGQG
jgi:hypothetical protein